MIPFMSTMLIVRLKESDIFFPWLNNKSDIFGSGIPRCLSGKESTCNQETQVRSLGQEEHQEKEMATHSSILVWDIPWTEDPGGLQFMESQRVKHDFVTKQQQYLGIMSTLCF